MELAFSSQLLPICLFPGGSRGNAGVNRNCSYSCTWDLLVPPNFYLDREVKFRKVYQQSWSIFFSCETKCIGKNFQGKIFMIILSKHFQLAFPPALSGHSAEMKTQVHTFVLTCCFYSSQEYNKCNRLHCIFSTCVPVLRAQRQRENDLGGKKRKINDFKNRKFKEN